MHQPFALFHERPFWALRFARGFEKELRYAWSRLIGALYFARGFKKDFFFFLKNPQQVPVTYMESEPKFPFFGKLKKVFHKSSKIR